MFYLFNIVSEWIELGKVVSRVGGSVCFLGFGILIENEEFICLRENWFFEGYLEIIEL